MKKKKKKKKSFSKTKTQNLLLSVFRKNPSKRLNYRQLCKLLKIKDSRDKVLVVEVLDKLRRDGFLKEHSKGSYLLTQKMTVTQGVVCDVGRKKLTIKTEQGIVFVKHDHACFSLKGDTVKLALTKKKDSFFIGEVLNVIKRKKSIFIGVLDCSSAYCFFIPDNPGVYFDVFIPKKLSSGDHLNKKLLVEVTDWSMEQKNPVGKITSVLGDISNHDVEMKTLLHIGGFSADFSKNIIARAESLSADFTKDIIKDRVDFRTVPTFTIDPDDAKDFDDAISVRLLKKGVWEIGVHIADVSFYVKEGSLIDKEAFLRSTSVYLVDRVVPMLPEVLSNDLCSLKPNLDRLVFSVIYEIDEQANILSSSIKKCIINSNKRFTYKAAQKIIDNDSGLFNSELKILNHLAIILKERRRVLGSIDFNRSETKFILDKNKNPIDILFKTPLQTNQLIEEFMLLANKTVAEFVNLGDVVKPFIYRVHDAPDKDKILHLERFVKSLGYSIDNSNTKNLSLSLNALLNSVKGKKEQKLIETITLRSMAKAIYSSSSIGHYGLGFSHYSHFTSPIRRYPDLIVHRLLSNYINNQTVSFNVDDLLCRHCSEKERLASIAERDSIKYMQVKFLENKIGSVFSGVISGVTDWGFYVELTENGCEGLVKVGSLKGGFFYYDEKKFALIGGGKTYQLGQTVKIKVLQADLIKKQLDFILV